MAKALFTNNASSTLYSTLAQGATTLVCASGEGARFPSPTGGDYFYLTIYEKDMSANEEQYEIVKVTARSSDTFTIVRDVENIVGVSGGRAYPTVALRTVYLELRLTAAGATEMLKSGDIGATVQAYDADLTTWAGKTAPSGTVVGDTDTQTLTNKTISADSNTLSGIAASSFVLSNGSGNIDGSASQKAIPSGVVVGTTDTQTLTNKTLTNPTVTNYTESIYTPSAGSSFTVDLTQGSIQYFWANANATITTPTPVAGKSFTIIMYQNGGTYTHTFSGATVKWPNNTQPTASANSKFDIYVFTAVNSSYWLGADGGRNF